MMRMRLPETGRRGERRLGGIVASVAAHGVVILLAVYATARGAPPPLPPATPQARVIYTAPVRPTPVEGGRRAGPPTGTAPAPSRRLHTPVAPPMLPPLRLHVDGVALPSTPLVGGTATPGEFTRGQALLGTMPGGGSGSGAGPLGAPEVERAAAPRTPVVPRYPEPLRARGLAGAVVARFVVDTIGRLAAGSLEIVQATHPLFADAVRDALARTRFTPAMAHGRRVPQLVEQRFEFRLGGGR